MFADHPDTYVEFLGSRYRGKEGVKRLYQGRFQNMFVKGRNGPVYGFLLDHIMMQDIVDVDSSGTHAWVRMRALMSAGTVSSDLPPRCFCLSAVFCRTPERADCTTRPKANANQHDSVNETHPRGHVQWWEGGLYENEYIKENGVWKLFRYRYFPFWHAEFESGWSHTKKNYIPWPTKTYPEDPLGPDEILEQKMLWVSTPLLPILIPTITF